MNMVNLAQPGGMARHQLESGPSSQFSDMAVSFLQGGLELFQSSTPNTSAIHRHLAVMESKMNKMSRKKENQWDPVKEACRFEGDMSPECIEAFYDHLDTNNHLEWSIWLDEFFANQLMTAVFGIKAVLEAPILALIMILVPGAKPDIKDAPWDEIELPEGIWYMWIGSNAWLLQTTAYFWTQLFTWGGSNLSDFQLIYMTNAEAALYFFTELLVLPFTIPFAVFWVIWTWWVYAIWIFYEVFLMFEHFDFEEKTEEDLGMKEKKSRRH